MTTGLKIYSAILVAIILIFIANFLYEPADVRNLNKLLSANEALAAYPYQFRVLRLENDIAIMSSPRSAQVGVPQIIASIDPNLKGVSISDPRFLEAQQRLAEHQALARSLVSAESGVSGVKWELDEAWLRQRGIY